MKLVGYIYILGIDGSTVLHPYVGLHNNRRVCNNLESVFDDSMSQRIVSSILKISLSVSSSCANLKANTSGKNKQSLAKLCSYQFMTFFNLGFGP